MDTGKQGEEVVAQWLITRGGKILHQRWRFSFREATPTKTGEIDLIAIESGTLLFIEVKTRNRSNWDADGLLAITPQKQARIVRTAQLFLLKHSYLADYPCRFDVAIVRHQPINKSISIAPLHLVTDITTGTNLLLIDYLPNAFDG